MVKWIEAYNIHALLIYFFPILLPPQKKTLHMKKKRSGFIGASDCIYLLYQLTHLFVNFL